MGGGRERGAPRQQSRKDGAAVNCTLHWGSSRIPLSRVVSRRKGGWGSRFQQRIPVKKKTSSEAPKEKLQRKHYSSDEEFGTRERRSQAGDSSTDIYMRALRMMRAQCKSQVVQILNSKDT